MDTAEDGTAKTGTEEPQQESQAAEAGRQDPQQQEESSSDEEEGAVQPQPEESSSSDEEADAPPAKQEPQTPMASHPSAGQTEAAMLSPRPSKDGNGEANGAGTEQIGDRKLSAPVDVASFQSTNPHNAPDVELNVMGGRSEIKDTSTVRYTTIKHGSIVFSWDNGNNKKKVPYLVIPDGLAMDPYFVEKIAEAMQVPIANLILRFSRLKEPVHSWNNEWNYDQQGDGEVDEDELPFPLPEGASRATAAVQKFMAQVVADRVADITKAIAQACAEAGAWINISDYESGVEPFGFFDYVTPIVAKGADKNSVIFATYSMEERRKLDGGTEFCNALDHYSGDPKSEVPEMRPRSFEEDVTADLKAMGLLDSFEVEGGVVKKEKKHKKNKQNAYFNAKLEAHFSKRQFLPTKDCTHLLIFESKNTELYFKEQLSGRTPVGNFIMNGSVAAMKMFSNAMKTGTPVFVLKGTGGAADKIGLVLDHMKWRKKLEEAGGHDSDSDESDLEAGASCIPMIFKRKRHKVANAGEEAGVVPEVTKGPGMKNILERLSQKQKLVQEEYEKATEDGDYVTAMSRKLMSQELKQMYSKGEELQAVLDELLVSEALNPDLVSEKSALVTEYSKMAEDLMFAREVTQNEMHVDHDDGDGDDHDNRSQAHSAHTGKSHKIDLSKVRKKKKSKDPEAVYNDDLELGKEARAWERKVGAKYETWKQFATPQDWKDMPPPENWDQALEGDEDCEDGTDPVDLTRIPCCLETCPDCWAVKVACRKEIRAIARRDKEWDFIEPALFKKYINYWIEDNPLSDDANMVLALGQDQISEMARVIFANIWEPPVEDAVVPINILDQEINLEEIMDSVTAAMSVDALVSEVGEKTAFRRRLLMGWQMVSQLKYNMKTQQYRMHFFQLLIIILTFISVLTGTVTYQINQIIANAEDLDIEPSYPGFEEMNFRTSSDVLQYVNVGVPLVAAFLLALNGYFSPATKMTTLRNAMFAVESEIYKCRSRTGEYAMSSGGAALIAGGAGKGVGESKEGEEGQEKKKAAKTVVRVNPRIVFARKMEDIWSDLGSSEMRQESMLKPNTLELVKLNRTVNVQEHPALYDEGKILSCGNKRLIRDTLDRYTYELEDDGLKNLSAPDYIDIRVAEYTSLYTKRAPRLSYSLSFCQFLIFTATSGSTALGAFGLTQWIAVTAAFGAAIGSIVAYTNLEPRLQRVNAAMVGINRLMAWWHGLSVIEKRIPSNKTFLVETMETIIQTEAGSVLVSANKENGADDQDGGGEK